MWSLETQKIVVVGGCGGIGKALVKHCINEKMRIAVLDLPKSIVENPVDSAVECIISIDATNEQEIKNAFDELSNLWGSVDHVVILSGFTNPLFSIETLETSMWNETVDGNLKSTFLCCKYGLPLLKKSSKGSIVTTSTGIAAIGPSGYAPYAAAKAGIIALTKTLAKEASPTIRVNCIAPGAVKTPFLGKGTGRGGREGDKPERVDLEQFVKLVPLGYVAEADDIAEPIMFLLSSAARYITGHTLHINGGSLMP